jgi:allophanate hydrolase subunit 1
MKMARLISSQMDIPAISAIGERAILFEAPGDFSMAQQRRIWALMQECRKHPEVQELIPGVTNLLLIFKTAPAIPRPSPNG